MPNLTPFDSSLLPAGVRSRFVENGNGLSMHLLEAGFEGGERPLVLLLHGFPELAYSWRKVLLPIAEAGYHVVAPDQRGYGRTTGWDGDYDGNVHAFRFFNLVRDAVGLVRALGHTDVTAVVGHDFGSPVAACCALARPDVFRSVVMMSAPFAGPPPFTPPVNASASSPRSIHDDLAALRPPRKHYQWYYSTREADGNMRHAPQGLHAFLRAYYHVKSADWVLNTPYPLAEWTAEELAKLPGYYVMPLEKGMAETVAPDMPTATHIASCAWLPERKLAVYAEEFGRTGFQGGLQWYRCGTGGINAADLGLFTGRTIDVPAAFISGKSDWGTYQRPGDLEAMERTACSRYVGTHLIEGAGHWVQQEQPRAVSRQVIDFLRQH